MTSIEMTPTDVLRTELTAAYHATEACAVSGRHAAARLALTYTLGLAAYMAHIERADKIYMIN